MSYGELAVSRAARRGLVAACSLALARPAPSLWVFQRRADSLARTACSCDLRSVPALVSLSAIPFLSPPASQFVHISHGRTWPHGIQAHPVPPSVLAACGHVPSHRPHRAGFGLRAGAAGLQPVVAAGAVRAGNVVNRCKRRAVPCRTCLLAPGVSCAAWTSTSNWKYAGSSRAKSRHASAGNASASPVPRHASRADTQPQRRGLGSRWLRAKRWARGAAMEPGQGLLANAQTFGSATGFSDIPPSAQQRWQLKQGGPKRTCGVQSVLVDTQAGGTDAPQRLVDGRRQALVPQNSLPRRRAWLAGLCVPARSQAHLAPQTGAPAVLRGHARPDCGARRHRCRVAGRPASMVRPAACPVRQARSSSQRNQTGCEWLTDPALRLPPPPRAPPPNHRRFGVLFLLSRESKASTAGFVVSPSSRRAVTRCSRSRMSLRHSPLVWTWAELRPARERPCPHPSPTPPRFAGYHRGRLDPILGLSHDGEPGSAALTHAAG